MTDHQDPSKKLRFHEIEKKIQELRSAQSIASGEPKTAERFSLLYNCYMDLAASFYDPDQPKSSASSKALEATEQALYFCGYDDQTYYRAGILATECSKWIAAGKYFYRAQTNDPDGELSQRIVELLIQHKVQFSKADPWLMQTLSRILFAYPESASQSALNEIAQDLKCQPNPVDVSEALAETALMHDPKAFYFYVRKAEIAKSEKDVTAEIDALEKAFQVDPSPFRQALLRQARVELGDSPGSGIPSDFPSAISYYNAGVFYGSMRQSFPRDSVAWNEAQLLAETAYAHSLKRFEYHFTTLQGTPEDSDLHVYSMCCRNSAMFEWEKKKYEACVSLHTRGIEISPFFEHFNERSHSYYMLKKMKEAGEDSQIVLSAFADNLDPALIIMHSYRVILGAEECGELERAAEVAQITLDQVENFSPNDRQAVEAQISALVGLCTKVFTNAGRTEDAAKLEKSFGEKPRIEAEVKGLLMMATEHLKKGEYVTALPFLERTSEIKPRNIDALNWRLWILVTLQNQAKDEEKVEFTPQIIAVAESVLSLITEASPEWGNTPKNALVKAFESALGNLAWQTLKSSAEKFELLTAITMIDEAMDPSLNFFRSDDLRYLLDTRVRLLLKLGMKEEAYPIVAAILSQDPSFQSFQEYVDLNEVQAILNEPASFELKALPKYCYLGKNKHTLRSQESTLLGEFVKETSLAYHLYRRQQSTLPTEEDFQITTEAFATGRQLLELSATDQKKAVMLCFTREADQFPEYGLFDNLHNDQPAHQAAVGVLITTLLSQDLDFSEAEMIELLQTQQWIGELLQGIKLHTQKQGLGSKLADELKQFAQLADEDEQEIIREILSTR